MNIGLFSDIHKRFRNPLLTMTQTEFYNTLHHDAAPASVNNILLALWYDAKGNWDRAHELVQDEDTLDAAWIHAYLHRKEGDMSNAGYWYRRAGKKIPHLTVQQEWEDLVTHFLIMNT